MNKQLKLWAFLLAPLFFSSCYGEYEEGAQLLPIADAGSDFKFVCPGPCTNYSQSKVLDGSASRDPLGEELTYQWNTVQHPEPLNFPDFLKNETEKQAFIKAHTAGEYIFSLVVTAGNRVSDPDYVTVIIAEPDGNSDK